MSNNITTFGPNGEVYIPTNAWVACGPNLTSAYWSRYNGTPGVPMDDRSFQIMSTMVDITVVQPLFSTKSFNGENPFTNYAMGWDDREQMLSDLAFLDATWPGQQFEINGAWELPSGLQVGESFIYDDEDPPQIIGIEGTPEFPIPVDAYELMPPIKLYDEDGNETGEVPATSNADLRDIYDRLQQAPRFFEDPLIILNNAGFDDGQPS
jgi:hypothetical protein